LLGIRHGVHHLLIAQSLVEGIPFISIDNVFDAYGVNRLW